jgi:FKBP-type peptidyl-prolyl cis-trans isomerase SlpA
LPSGDGSLLPGFERVLLGMRPGSAAVPGAAGGRLRPAQREQRAAHRRDNFDDDIELELGLVCSFADAAGGELPGMVVAFDDAEVTVDFNHPLAGRTILFDVHIHRIEAAELH